MQGNQLPLKVNRDGSLGMQTVVKVQLRSRTIDFWVLNDLFTGLAYNHQKTQTFAFKFIIVANLQLFYGWGSRKHEELY